MWNQPSRISLRGDGQKTVVHTAGLPAGVWLVGGKVDVVNNDLFPIGVQDAYYRCELRVNGNAVDQSSVLMGTFEVEVQTLTVFTTVDSGNPFTVTLACGADGVVVAHPYVEGGRLWAASAAEVSGF
jgi:hypothetical protein